MGKRRAVIFLALLILVCGGFVYFWIATREPVYQGKTLTVWLDQYRTNEAPYNHDPEGPAQTAIRHFGTNEIPRYLKLLSRRPSALRTKLFKFIPQAWSKRLHIPSTLDDEGKLWPVRARGAYGLIALGSDAKSAVPALMARLDDKREEAGARYFAIYTIYRLGPVARDALPLVMRCVNDQDSGVRSDAILALGSIHGDAEHVVPLLVDVINKGLGNRMQNGEVYFALDSIAKFKGEASNAVPTIIKSLDHPEISVRSQAIRALRDIHTQPELAVPALIEHLKTTKTKNLDERRMIYTYTFTALDSYGPAARSAVPTLLQSVNDEDEDIRKDARGALKDIDPEAAAKAGFK